MFVIDETMIALFHIDDGFYALDALCPHAGASLAHGIINDCTVSCRIHHWRFDIRNGEYLDEPKPQFNARSFATKVVGNDVLVQL